MDTELFMECEEEELEPWQQVDDSVEEDELDCDSYCEPVEDSSSPLPACETPPPRSPRSVASAAASSSGQNVSSVMPPPLSIITSSSSLPRLPAPSSPAVSAPPLMAQAPPLILTQTAGRTFLLPAGTGTGRSQPILLTTQGFPVQTVVNPGTPLLLNLQPGQTVQPLTLIQSSSLGHLVRPSVTVSPVLAQGKIVQTRPAPTRPGSAFTALELPTTLAIGTSTPAPVNLQLTQVSSPDPLKLGGSPTLPSGLANGVTRTALFSSASGPTAPTVRLAVTPDPPRVVMSVGEFYYGTFEGDLSLRKPLPLGIKTSTFSCHVCSYLAENNLRLMQHMLQHSELTGGGGGAERRCCRFCYRQFSSPAQMKSHQEQVHGPAPTSSTCRICEWAFENEPAFLNHMKCNHKPGEMPYICQVCSYRSSVYSDVLQHFASFHRDSRFLLCVFCLKVTRNPPSYQQHVLRHQINQAFHCSKCRLQFVLLKDKMQHKLENHHSVRLPAQLEGLPIGSKVTIRTYGKLRRPITSTGSSLVQPSLVKKLLRSPVLSRPPRSPTRRPIGRRVHVGRSCLACLECGTDASDFAAHYPTHVRCLLCPFSSCCSRAFAAHMIRHHVQRTPNEALPLHRLPPPCPFLLRCSQCDLSPQTADQMAEHLLVNPEHHSATCRTRTYMEQDLQFCPEEDQQVSEQKEPGQNSHLPDPSWRSADGWKEPLESDGGPSIVPFTQFSGPRHFLSKNSDAIDFFNLLFPAALVELITSETNAHAKICQFLGFCPSDWVPVTTHEVSGFIGLVVLMGIQNLADPSHYWSWSHYDNSSTFHQTMSFKRFNQIEANIRMGSFTTDEHRGNKDPSDSLHIFRPMLEILGGAMWSAYRPNCCLTIDRALLPGPEDDSCRAEGSPEVQPQAWLLCDSKSGYCHRLFIRAGEKVGQGSGFTVVPELMKGLEDKHHQVYLSNSLTSVPLMQKLLDQGIYASSSFPPSNPILPRELWEKGHLGKPGDFLQMQFGPLLATCWRDTKEVVCLATNAGPGEPDTVWRRSQTKVGGLDSICRPKAFRLLQENMRGVDICKQLLACNPLGGIRQDRRWRRLFWFLVNLSVVNAFIVLRESRKENPPTWVHDGLFTQAMFRRRLGVQLARYAQGGFESAECASFPGTGTHMADETAEHKHRMAKISGTSKRCRNCNLKSIRRESVYGCVVCRANLCKRPSCFWEYHGLSPVKGSTKVGLVKDRKSGTVEVDGAMAPVEDLDFSEDDLVEVDKAAADIKEEEAGEVQHPVFHLPSAANSHDASRVGLSGSKHREDFFTARQLRIALFALCDGPRRASRVFSTEVRLIWTWLRDARRRLERSEQEQMTHGEGEERLVAWVLSMREQQLPINETNLFHKASTLKKKGGFSESFLISYVWAVNFMLRHRLGVQSIGRAATLARSLPPFLESKVRSFRNFTQKVIQVHKLPGSAVAAMDELCLFVDLRSVQEKSLRSEAVELTGSLPLVTVYLAALADGTMLPSLVQVNRRLAEKVLPEFILLDAGAESLVVEDALDLWMNKIWLQHVSRTTEAGKWMLILDRHREHAADRFVSAVGASGTLPAVIPGGCAFCLQPLEVCLKPVLQRVLLSRWTRFTSGDPEELEELSPSRLQTNVAELLVDWLVEALGHFNKLHELWKKSFYLTGLLPGHQKETEQVMSQKPEDMQLQLLKTLTETLLGPDILEVDPSDSLEQEDEDRQEEVEQQAKMGKEDLEKKKGTEVDGQEMKQENKKQKLEEEQKSDDEERRETRIVTGEEVGDEWKIKSRTEEDNGTKEAEERHA